MKPAKKYGQMRNEPRQKDDLMRLVEREMMRGKPSRQKVKDMDEKRDWNRRQEESLQKDVN